MAGLSTLYYNESMDEQISIIKADGTREPFDNAKLTQSLRRAGATEKAIEETLSHVEHQLAEGMTTHEIYKRAFEFLDLSQKPIAMRYSLKHAIMDLGPSGFPFEDFVAAVFREKGFETLTGQMVKGFCVEHEIDVVAWNEEKLIMVEAKFHNELGIKSDLKIALYVKARFDDLRKMKFNYGGQERDLDEGWLVTNTKFTSTAIEYGSCQGGMHMVGWNYPPIGNLHDMILESRLHPLTCLVSLSGRDKKVLLEKGIVLCKTVHNNPELLQSLGLSDEKMKAVIKEIDEL